MENDLDKSAKRPLYERTARDVAVWVKHREQMSGQVVTADDTIERIKHERPQSTDPEITWIFNRIAEIS